MDKFTKEKIMQLMVIGVNPEYILCDREEMKKYIGMMDDKDLRDAVMECFEQNDKFFGLDRDIDE